MLKLINNKNINGKFYIENFDEREEEDRVKIYDSDENYLDGYEYKVLATRRISRTL